jgi:hypothetical protein
LATQGLWKRRSIDESARQSSMWRQIRPCSGAIQTNRRWPPTSL